MGEVEQSRPGEGQRARHHNNPGKVLMAVVQFLSPFNDPDDILDNGAIQNFERGVISDVLLIRIYNDRDNVAGLVRINGRLLISTEDPTNPNVGLATGIEPQDEFWAEARFVSQSANNTEFTTDWQRLGAFTGIDFPGLEPDSYREYELRFRPPSFSTPGSLGNFRFFLQVFLEETSFAIPGAHSIDILRGIVVGSNDLRATYVVDGMDTVPSIVPDDNVTVEAGNAFARGLAYAISEVIFPLDELDFDLVQLLVGQSYIALLSLSPLGVVELLKGLGGGTPASPALPSGHAFIKRVTVFENGGTPEINAVDLSGVTTRGRFELERLGGLVIRIHPGNALAGGTSRIWTTYFDITLSPNVISHIWQLQDGKYSIIEDDSEPPNPSSMEFYEVTTDATDVTIINDQRIFIGAVNPQSIASILNILNDWGAIAHDSVTFPVGPHLDFSLITPGDFIPLLTYKDVAAFGGIVIGQDANGGFITSSKRGWYILSISGDGQATESGDVVSLQIYEDNVIIDGTLRKITIPDIVGGADVFLSLSSAVPIFLEANSKMQLKFASNMNGEITFVGLSVMLELKTPIPQ